MGVCTSKSGGAQAKPAQQAQPKSAVPQAKPAEATPAAATPAAAAAAPAPTATPAAAVDVSSIEGVLTAEQQHEFLELGKQEKFKGSEASAAANKLHDEGKIDESKPFRAAAKEHYVKSTDYQKKVGISMALKAQNSAEPEIDLHNFFLDEAMVAVQDAFDHLKERKTGATKFRVIPGAGTHSDPAKGIKIKPAVIKYLNDNGYEYAEETHGSYIVTLK